MAYAEKWDDYSSDFEILEAGIYTLELSEISGPYQQVNTFNPGEGPVDKYYWDFAVFKEETQVHEGRTGEPFRYRMFVSDAMGPNSHTMKLLEAMDCVPDKGTPAQEWQDAALGKRLVANVHVVETTTLAGEKKQKNKIAPRTDVKRVQQGDVKQEAPTNAAEGPPGEGNAADEKLPF